MSQAAGVSQAVASRSMVEFVCDPNRPTGTDRRPPKSRDTARVPGWTRQGTVRCLDGRPGVGVGEVWKHFWVMVITAW